ncbi:MAG TPA: hypothetical protein VFT72_04910 [Opitutaceae bacterium]|nr:hypothetical protein [Opitutaceae bacterium]
MKILSRSFLGKSTSIAYPHGNSFTADGESVVVCRTADESGRPPQLLIRNLQTSEIRALPPIPTDAAAVQPNTTICFDVAHAAPRLVATYRADLWTLHLRRGATWRHVFAQPEGVKIQDLPAISPDGRRCLIGLDDASSHGVVEVDLESTQTRTLFVKKWHANHFHYSPHDPSWIGFAHEGPAEQITDRCWVWHPTHAPEGRVVFNQFKVSDDPAKPLAVGHERWTFHDVSAYVVAYAVSPSTKRGLYEMFADGREPRLLRETNTAWHCNVDASGRFAVIDTSAAWDAVPARGPEFENGVARHRQADREKLPNLSDIVLFDLRTGEHLCVARATRTKHPFHPHPALSADARWLVFSDATPGNTGSWLIELDLS